MTDRIIFQSDDALSEQNLSQQRARENSTDYVERGLDVSADWASSEVDVAGGHAVIKDGVNAYDVFPDARTNKALADGSGVNYVWLVVDPSNQDDVSIDINTSGSAPSSAALLVAEVDASSEEVSPRSRAPDATFGETAHEMVSTESSVITGAGRGATTQLSPSAQDLRTLPKFPTNFEKASDGPIINIQDEIGYPSIFHAGRFLDNPLDEWYLYCSSHNNYGINLLTAPSLSLSTSWTDQGVLFDANSFSATENHVAGPSVVWNDSTSEVWLFYHTVGDDGTSDQHQYQRLAKSTDGQSFSDAGQINDPQRLPLWDGKERSYLSVTRYNNMFVGLYQGRGQQASPSGLGLAYSQTGEIGTWRRTEAPLFGNNQISPLIDLDSSLLQMATPTLTEFGGQLWVLCALSPDESAYSIYAIPISDVGQTTGQPQKIMEPTLSWEENGIAWPEPYFEGQKLHLFYHSTGNTSRQIGHATADFAGVGQ